MLAFRPLRGSDGSENGWRPHPEPWLVGRAQSREFGHPLPDKCERSSHDTSWQHGSGDFDQLVGVIEVTTLETKRAPYQTGEDHQKAELAKDASALANRAGGVLGPATHRDPSHLGEEITSIATYARNLVDSEHYFAIVFRRARRTLLSWCSRATATKTSRQLSE